MYKLIILDDDEMIRQGLKEFVPWDSMGFQVVDEFEDGTEAIEYLRSREVDVVFTDIEMNRVDGLEVARYIYEHKPETKVVILSGHRSFDYAKRAMVFNVQNYIVKPTNIDEVSRVFQDLKHKLDREQENKQKLKEEQDRYEQVFPLLQESFITDVLTGALTNADMIAYRASRAGLPASFITNGCCIVDVQVQEPSEDMLHKLRNLLTKQSRTLQYYPLFGRIEDLKVFVSLPQQANRSILIREVENFRLKVRALFGISLVANPGYCYRDLFALVERRRHGEADSAGEVQPSSSSQLIGRIQAYMTENYHQDLSLVSVADKVFLNPVYLSRLFKQHLGLNFSEYLTSIRIEKAKQLLQQGEYQIHEISEKTGYRNSKYFSRVFRQITDCSPSEYRRKHILVP